MRYFQFNIENKKKIFCQLTTLHLFAYDSVIRKHGLQNDRAKYPIFGTYFNEG